MCCRGHALFDLTGILNLARGATLGDAAVMLNTSLHDFRPLIAGAPAPIGKELTNGDIVSFVPISSDAPDRHSLASAAADALGTTQLGSPSLGVGAADGLVGAVRSTTTPSLIPSTPRSTASGRGADEVAGGALANELPLRMCTRCLPLPGDPLVCTAPASGRQSPAAAVSASLSGAPSSSTAPPEPPHGTLHRADCDCLEHRRQLAAGDRQLRPTPAQQARMHSAIRAHEVGHVYCPVYATKLIVFTPDRPGMLLTVSSLVTDEVINIINVHSETREVGGESAFQYRVHVRDVAMLDALVRRLVSHQDVLRVLRADMDDLLHDSKDIFWAHAYGDEPSPAPLPVPRPDPSTAPSGNSAEGANSIWGAAYNPSPPEG